MEPPDMNTEATERTGRSYILLLKPPSIPGSVEQRMSWDISRGRAMPYDDPGDSSVEATTPASASDPHSPHSSIIGASEEEATEDESSTLAAEDDVQLFLCKHADANLTKVLQEEEEDPPSPSTLEDSDGELSTKKYIMGRHRSSARKLQKSQYASHLRDPDRRYSSTDVTSHISADQGYTAAMNIDVNDDGLNRGRPQDDEPKDDKQGRGKAAKRSKVKAMFRRIKSIFQGGSNVSESDLQQSTPSSTRPTREIFDLLVDTGSNTSWVMGSETKKIRLTDDGEAILEDWKDSDIRRDPIHTVLPISALERMHEEECITGHVKYGEGEAQLVLSLPGELEIDLLCVDWVLKDSGRIAVNADLGIAWALSRSLHRDPADGILGLGRLEIQPDFHLPENQYEVRAFMDNLKHRLTKPNARAYTLWFAIRPPYRTVRTTPVAGTSVPLPVEQSWLAYQEWPCLAFPQFSPPLAMDPVVNDAWVVQLIRMTFRGFAGTRSRFGSEYVINMADYMPNLRPKDSQSSKSSKIALPVCLDTGCSVSYLPHNIVLNIRKYGAPQLPPEFPNSGVTVVYDFMGVNGKVVSVTGSCRPFLTAFNPAKRGNVRECLIVPQDSGRSESIFGLNWFNTMFVGMHKGVHGDDYVTLAPQRLSEMSRYTMPSLDEA
ncbi:hypothetical protein NUW54_g592 [Trametes sanguinea]|uniref:Uncharacterized protein n=1 Tax=Trametes sanguinea TaxID=158606 RepID=A0ACC1QAH6_9APHY|nr:hypothetical protein NUW54_g592 [Trametes sanguinea]